MFSHPESKEQMDVPFDPHATPPYTTAELSEDTALDSSTSEEEGAVCHLSLAQKQHIKEGAYAVRHPLTTEALVKHKSAFKQPVPHIVAARDLSVNPPATQCLAEAIVLADLPPQEEIDPLADMPELEEFLP